MEIKIKNLQPGDKAEIIAFSGKDVVYRSKLLAMGLTRGTVFTLKKIAPLGDPLEIEVRGFKLSLRKAEADILQIRRKSDE